MTLTINTNIAATRASKYLAANHQNLQKSLDRLSSGKRIASPSDDAGGLAVSMKLQNSIFGLKGAASNISNAISLLQVQDGILESAGQIVSRMGELKSMYSDVTKNSTDKGNYNSEYQDLIGQLLSMSSTDFNGVTLFSTGADTSLDVDSGGGSTIAITQQGFANEINAGAAGDAIVATAATQTLDGNTAAQFSAALEAVASMRAANGGETKRLQYALADVNTQITNLTAANGRIMDVDVATESSNLARQQVLVQASAAMTAQANMANDVALMLLR